MPLATVSSKGQITLPAALRRAVGIKVKDRVFVEEAKGTIVVRPVPDFFALRGFLGKALPPQEERRRMARGIARDVLGSR